MFPAEVDSPDHPYAAQFREILENAAKECNGKLLSFDVHEGTVTFSFDNDELTAEIIDMLNKNA